MDINVLWQQCLILIKEQLGESVYTTWIIGLRVDYIDNKMIVIANNKLIHNYLSNKYWSHIKQIINYLANNIIVEFIALLPINVSDDKLADKSIHTSKFKQTVNKEALQSLQIATKLNLDYTFDSLVQGNSNQLACAIASHVTQKPGNKNHNPLFIYGGIGLGKTHLMQSIGNAIYKKNPKAKIRYLHANDYIQDVVKASLHHGFNELKKYYNSLDVLLMDDIQFIGGDKVKSQEEFFYIFNTLLERNKQIILTCDTYPKNITNLNNRLISRFTSGLTVEIQAPELEMRIAILKHKAQQNRIILSDEIAFFIAQNIKSNVRELEGALNKVLYQAQFSGRDLSVSVAQEALMDLLAIDSRNVSIDDIQQIVCNFYKLNINDLLSTKRTQSISRPRQIAMTLAKCLTQNSLPIIGNAFGGRNHSTVLYAHKIISQLRKSNKEIDKDYNSLMQILNKSM